MADFAALDIVVLAGGISHERDISLRSGRRVADGLHALGHRVTFRDPDASLLASLADHRPDVIWPALHGASGEDGALRALLEVTGIPFVGSRAESARLAWSKPTAKTLVGRAGVATPASVALPKETFRELGANSVLSTVLDGMPTPLVVKPAQGGSAQGVTIVQNAEDLPRAMVDAYTYCDVALIEKKIEGVEVSVAVVDTGNGPQALPPVEIVPVGGEYTYDARYNAGETRFFVPARLEADVISSVSAAATSAHEALGLRHLSRIDLIVDATGTPWFLEANVLPGLTETSIMPQAIAAAGLDLGELYAALARAAIADSTQV